jgi:hypothetical protein
MTRAAILLGALFVALTAADAAVRPKETVGTLERAVRGEWTGGPCQGTWMFRPDGTFELTQYSPANNTLSGTWGIRWATPRPTLGITINASDRPEHVGTKWELKIIELDDEALTGEYPGGSQIRLERKRISE